MRFWMESATESPSFSHVNCPLLASVSLPHHPMPPWPCRVSSTGGRALVTRFSAAMQPHQSQRRGRQFGGGASASAPSSPARRLGSVRSASVDARGSGVGPGAATGKRDGMGACGRTGSDSRPILPLFFFSSPFPTSLSLSQQPPRPSPVPRPSQLAASSSSRAPCSRANPRSCCGAWRRTR